MAVAINSPYLTHLDDDLEYRQKHLSFNLQGAQQLTLKRILAGCIDDGATLANGKTVRTGADALKYLVELVAAGAP